MSLYLAIDAGGTKAEYILADDHRVLARTLAGTIKRMRVSAEIASANLHAAFSELQAQSGRSLKDVSFTCIGTAGETVPLVTDWLRGEMATHVGGDLLLLGDVEIALDANFRGEHGVLVLAGTGSNVMGRGPGGALAGAGGWGPVLADQASGHRIGQQALRAIFLALDEDRQTSLLEDVLGHWNLKSVAELVGYANTCPVTEFSALTPLVLRNAERGDAVANELLVCEGRDLAHLAVQVMRKLARIEGTAGPARFAYAGSILEHVHPVRAAVTAELLLHFPDATIQETAVAPVEGALWRATQHAPTHQQTNR